MLLSTTVDREWTGTTHIVFTPHELIEKLIPLIPRPRCHLVRYHGILCPAAKDRDKVVPTAPAPSAPETAGAEAAGDDNALTGEFREIDITKIQRGSRLPWAVLLKRVFLTDALTCPKCQGRMKILAAITEPEAIRKILDHLGIPSEAPPRTAARPRRRPSFRPRPTSPTSTTLTRPAPSGDRSAPPKAGPGIGPYR